RCVPVVDLSHAVRKRLKLRELFRPRRPKRVRRPLQMALKDPVDHMYMVEDAKHDRGVLFGQPIEILANNIEEAAIGPSFVGNELGVRLADHESLLIPPRLRCAFDPSWLLRLHWSPRMYNTSDSSYLTIRIWSAVNGAQTAYETEEIRLSREI